MATSRQVLHINVETGMGCCDSGAVGHIVDHRHGHATIVGANCKCCMSVPISRNVRRQSRGSVPEEKPYVSVALEVVDTPVRSIDTGRLSPGLGSKSEVCRRTCPDACADASISSAQLDSLLTARTPG